MSGSIRAYWSRGPQPGNLGDVLTPWLIQQIAGRPAEWVHPSQPGSHLVIGSVMKYAAPGVTIWGAGAMRASDTYSPEATYAAVRGPLSRDYILRDGGTCGEVYGDPAVLLPRYHNKIVEQTHRLGIVPHYCDYAAARAAWEHLPEVRVIDVLRADPLAVVDEIRSCQAIVSSSLHGLIVAQSYGLPAGWIECVGAQRLTGDGTKFQDWFLSNGCDEEQRPWPVTGREGRADLLAFAEGFEVSIDRDSLLAACPFARTHKAPPLVISFYTPSYEQSARRLMADCRRLGLPYRIEPLADRGEWIDNTRHKGEYVWKCLRESQRPVLWIDADGSLLQYPHLLAGGAGGVDFRARPKPPDHSRPWYVGTLWFNSTPGGRALARAWAERCVAAGQDISDERCLSEIWPSLAASVRHAPLPAEYCTWPRDEHEVADPVILHRLSGEASKFQARAAA